jgi:hypothetical protein
MRHTIHSTALDVLHVTFQGAPTMEWWHTYEADIRAAYAARAGVLFTILFDTTQLAMPTDWATVTAKIGLMKALKPFSVRHVVAAVVVAPNPFVRQLITSINAASPAVTPLTMVADVDEAQRAVARIRANVRTGSALPHAAMLVIGIVWLARRLEYLTMQQ